MHTVRVGGHEPLVAFALVNSGEITVDVGKMGHREHAMFGTLSGINSSACRLQGSGIEPPPF